MKAKPGDAWPTVLAVIVTWNGRDDLARCLESVARQDYPSERLEILVVDNASTDDSQETCRDICPRAVWLRNPSNLGYARAVNAGIRHGMANGSRYVWVLNNDVIAGRGTLRQLVAAGESHGDIGVICPVVCAMEEPDRIENIGYKINFWTGRLRRRQMGHDIFTDSEQQYAHVDSVLGCSNLIKMEVVERVGLFREIYGVYFEETDFNVRARRSGFGVVVVREARVLHRGSSTMNRFIFRRAWLLLRNLLLFEWYNAGPVRLAVFIPWFALVHLPWFVVRGCIYVARAKLKAMRSRPSARPAVNVSMGAKEN